MILKTISYILCPPLFIYFIENCIFGGIYYLKVYSAIMLLFVYILTLYIMIYFVAMRRINFIREMVEGV
jgi:hypothetical protein